MGYDVEVGKVLDGRFKILDVVTRSGMASIFEAIDTDSGEIVAVKVPLMQCESDPTLFTRFQMEEEIGIRLKHPYILRVIPVAKKSRPYLVSEFLKGQTLGQKLRNVRPLPQDDALKIASRICEALAYMHEHGVVHRDLKPDNVMLCADGSIRIMDFGIAKTNLRRLTVAGFTAVLGTPDYMAPEQVKGQRGDARTDIYCLGAMLYEMAVGAVPFPGDNPFAVMNARMIGGPLRPREIRPELSPQVEEIVLHALEFKPEKRYQNALEMKAELDAPEAVVVTNRSLHMARPPAWKIWWMEFRLPVIAVLFPVIVLIFFYLISRR